MQYGPPLDKSKILGIIEGAPWNGVLELNRMAFKETLPRNSESRAIAISVRMLKRAYPDLLFIVTFADASQCGDGTIYRASGFLLTQIKETRNLARLPSGEVVHKMTLEGRGGSVPRPELNGRTYFDATGGAYNFKKYCAEARAEPLAGYQIRYILPLRKDLKINCPILKYSEIAKRGATMYLGNA